MTEGEYTYVGPTVGHCAASRLDHSRSKPFGTILFDVTEHGSIMGVPHYGLVQLAMIAPGCHCFGHRPPIVVLDNGDLLARREGAPLNSGCLFSTLYCTVLSSTVLVPGWQATILGGAQTTDCIQPQAAVIT